MVDIDRIKFKAFAQKHQASRRGQGQDVSNTSELAVYDRTMLRRFFLKPTEISNTEAEQFNRSSSLLSIFRAPDGLARGLSFRKTVTIALYRPLENKNYREVFYCIASVPGGSLASDADLAEILQIIRETESGSQFQSRVIRVPKETIEIMLEGMRQEAARKKTVQQMRLAPVPVQSVKSEEDVIRAFFKGTDLGKSAIKFGKFSIVKYRQRWWLFREGTRFAVRSDTKNVFYVRNDASSDMQKMLKSLGVSSMYVAPKYLDERADQPISSLPDVKKDIESPKGEKKLDFEPVEDKTGIHWYETSEELLDLLAKTTPSGYHTASGSGHVYWIPDDWEGGIAICAHTDTVWHHKVSVAVKSDGSAVSAVHGQGIGADDRSGVLVSEEAAKRYPGKFVHMFFDGEEVGCTGSGSAPVGFPVDLFLSLDRRGNNQVALYGYDNPEVRKMFQDAGGTLAQGSNTDCAVLARRFGKCCANLSVGFNSEHRAEESYDPSGVEYALRVLGKLEKRQFQDQEPEKVNSFHGGEWRTFFSSDRDWSGQHRFGSWGKSKSVGTGLPLKPALKGSVPAYDRKYSPHVSKATTSAWRSFEDWDDEGTTYRSPEKVVDAEFDDAEFDDIFGEKGHWEEIEEEGWEDEKDTKGEK